MVLASALLGAGSIASALPFPSSWHMPSAGDPTQGNRVGPGGPAGTGCKTVVYVPKPSLTSWTFTWTAPAAGTGPVPGYDAVVDGDHNGESSQGDDVKVGQLKLAEGN